MGNRVDRPERPFRLDNYEKVYSVIEGQLIESDKIFLYNKVGIFWIFYPKEQRLEMLLETLHMKNRLYDMKIKESTDRLLVYQGSLNNNNDPIELHIINNSATDCIERFVGNIYYGTKKIGSYSIVNEENSILTDS